MLEDLIFSVNLLFHQTIQNKSEKITQTIFSSIYAVALEVLHSEEMTCSTWFSGINMITVQAYYVKNVNFLSFIRFAKK